MEKVKYNIAIQTYMEVFDYLINNGLLVFKTDKELLSLFKQVRLWSAATGLL